MSSEIKIDSVDLADVQKEIEGLRVTLPLLAVKRLMRLAKIGQEAEERQVRNGSGGGSRGTWKPKVSDEVREQIRERLRSGDPVPIIAAELNVQVKTVLGMRVQMQRKGELP